MNAEVSVGFAGGRVSNVATNRILLKNVAVVGVHLGLYRQQCPDPARRWMTDLLALAAAHKFRPVLFRTLPLRDAAQALGLLAARTSYGKVVLVP